MAVVNYDDNRLIKGKKIVLCGGNFIVCVLWIFKGYFDVEKLVSNLVYKDFKCKNYLIHVILKYKKSSSNLFANQLMHSSYNTLDLIFYISIWLYHIFISHT